MTTGAFVALFGLLAAAPGLLAQDATPVADDAGHPAHIHAGTCDDLDPEPLFPLTDVVEPTGDVEGAEEAIVGETSVSTVDVALEDILADDHSINVHLSTEEAETYIACGEIGGPRQPDGSIVIGLRELNDSGHVGVAYLVSSPDDAATTNVSLFLIEPDGDTDDGEGVDDDEDVDDDATPVT
jgi:hypothetical protein